MYQSGNNYETLPEVNSAEANFKFSEKRGKLDWKALSDIDMDRLIRETDIDKLERLLQNVTFS